MRWVRYREGGRTFYGVLEDDRLREGVGDPFHGWRENGHLVALSAAHLLAPCEPTKIVAVGLNYRDHAAEMKKAPPEEPLLFIKPGTAVIGPGEQILGPPQSKQVEFEGELAIVIGRMCRRITPGDALDFILGYTCMIDVTARDIQRREGQYTRAKGFDTFAPLGPWIDTAADPADLEIETYVNGERRQASRTSELIFSPAFLVSFISQVMTLLPGDVVSTGTPAGVGPLHPGDVVEVRIESIGALRCGVGGA
ncbi:MAG: fumarylacetoacetate hydrolase family protein [Deltaproteobacteria bacterium]|nr:fumarylacetoacetate hydrolase family protein [Deltaproteobacteria bacterium]